MSFSIEKLIEKLEELAQRLHMLEKRIDILEGVGKVLQHSEPEKQQESIELPVEKNKLITVQSVELTIGKYWMQAVGAIILALGIGFFVKYAFDHQLLSPMARVITGFMFAALLIFLGEFVGHYIKKWSQGLAISGITILYITLYAANKLYALIDTNQAAIGFVCMGLLAALLTLRHNSQLIAVFACVNGFLCPLILTRYTALSWFIVVYFSVFALFYVNVSLLRRWKVAIIITELLFFMVASGNYGESISLPLLLMALCIFLCLPYIYVIVKKQATAIFESIIMVIAALVSFHQIQRLLYSMAYTILPAQSHPLYKFLFIGEVSTGGVGTRMRILFGVLLLAMAVIAYVRNRHVNAVQWSLVGLLFYFWGFLAFHGNPHGVYFGEVFPAFAVWVVSTIVVILLKRSVSIEFIKPFAPSQILIYTYTVVSLLYFIATFSRNLVYVDNNELYAGLSLLLLSCIALTYLFCSNERDEKEQNCTIMGVLAFFAGLLWFNTPLFSSHVFFCLGLLIYDGFLVITGLWLAKFEWRLIGYVYSVFASLVFMGYMTKDTTQIWLLWQIIAVSCVGIICAIIELAMINKDAINKDLELYEQKYAPALISLLAVFFVWTIGFKSLEHYLLVSGYLVSQLTRLASMAVYNGIFALLLIFIGLLRRMTALRYAGLALMVIVLYMVFVIVFKLSGTLDRVIVMAIVGIAMILISFAYQAFMKYSVQERK